MLAWCAHRLNIPPYINLYGYGYRNIYELHELVDVRDPRLRHAGVTAIPSSSTVVSGGSRFIKVHAEMGGL